MAFFFSFFRFISFSLVIFSLIDDRLPGYAIGNMQIVKDVGNYFITS